MMSSPRGALGGSQNQLVFFLDGYCRFTVSRINLMSILLADTSTTQIASPEPLSPAPLASNSWVLWICVGWALLGVLVTYLFGAFQKRSIVGPQRLAPEESAWDLLVILFTGFVSGIAIGGPLTKLVHFTPQQKELENLALNAAIGVLTFLTIVTILRFFRPGVLLQLGLKPNKIGHGMIGGGVTLFIMYPLIQLTGAAVESIYTHFNLTQAKPHELLVFLGQGHDQLQTTFAIALAVIIAPFTEELMYRGLLQTILGRLFSWMDDRSVDLTAPSKAGPRWMAVIFTSAIFAAVHVEPAFLAPLFVLALGLGYVYERTGNLWITITCHGLFNAAQILLSRAASAH